MAHSPLAQPAIFVTTHFEEGCIGNSPGKRHGALRVPSQPLYWYPPLAPMPFSKPVGIAWREYLACCSCPSDTNNSNALRIHEDCVTPFDPAHVARIFEIFPRCRELSFVHQSLRAGGPSSVGITHEGEICFL